ncbi:MAG: hypothetical protein IJ856_02815, partial [Candidatus Methanomethylophilaceae archaeon]|nr:hypothetical protein [Candidatus Methanomethylophilaceae archaeon]
MSDDYRSSGNGNPLRGLLKPKSRRGTEKRSTTEMLGSITGIITRKENSEYQQGTSKPSHEGADKINIDTDLEIYITKTPRKTEDKRTMIDVTSGESGGSSVQDSENMYIGDCQEVHEPTGFFENVARGFRNQQVTGVTGKYNEDGTFVQTRPAKIQPPVQSVVNETVTMPRPEPPTPVKMDGFKGMAEVSEVTKDIRVPEAPQIIMKPDSETMFQANAPEVPCKVPMISENFMAQEAPEIPETKTTDAGTEGDFL